MTYLIHIRTNNIITRKQIESGNEGSANVQSMCSRITYVARSVVIISVEILFVAEFLHSGLYVNTLRLLEITPYDDKFIQYFWCMFLVFRIKFRQQSR